MREIIQTDKAPKAIGPYSQAIKVDGFLFISGQIALDTNGKMSTEGIQTQTSQVLENLSHILTAAGSSLSQVVKVSIFLADMQDFVAMNEIYAEFFGEILPARECIQAAALPKAALVEMSLIAKV